MCSHDQACLGVQRSDCQIFQYDSCQNPVLGNTAPVTWVYMPSNVALVSHAAVHLAGLYGVGFRAQLGRRGRGDRESRGRGGGERTPNVDVSFLKTGPGAASSAGIERSAADSRCEHCQRVHLDEEGEKEEEDHPHLSAHNCQLLILSNIAYYP